MLTYIKQTSGSQKWLVVSLLLVILPLSFSAILAWKLGLEVNRFSQTLKFKSITERIADNTRDLDLIANSPSIELTKKKELMKQIEQNVDILVNELGNYKAKEIDANEILYIDNLERIWNDSKVARDNQSTILPIDISYFNNLISRHELEKISRDEPKVIKSLSTLVIILSLLTLFFIFLFTFFVISIIKESERKKELLADLSAAKEKALSAVKIKSQFLATVSHEIRTPMNGIISITEILLKENLNKQHKKLIKTIDSSGRTLMRIINDILDFSSIEKSHINLVETEFLVSDVITQVVESLDYKAKEKNNNIQLTIHEDVPQRIVSDPDRITQVLFNILGNAIKFTNNGSIDVEVKVVGKSPEQTLIFSIKDNGIGIDTKNIDDIFLPFTQLRTAGTIGETGTGLGLSITKQLVDALSGEIQINSLKGVGTQVIISIPFKINQTDRNQDEGTLVNDFSQSRVAKAWPTFEEKLDILCAEDNMTNQLVVREILTRMGANVTLINNGKDCLSMVNRHYFDVLLMDCQMPEMDGYETTRSLRKDHYLGPIIAMTASVQQDDRGQCFDAGMDGFIPKPIHSDSIYAEVQKVLLKKLNVLDLSTLSSLRKNLGQASLNRILTAYSGNLDELKTQLDNYSDSESSSLVVLNKVGHKMKSSSMTVGAYRLAHYCAYLEKADQSNLPPSLIEKGLLYLEQAQSAVDQILSQNHQTSKMPH
jgi:two-component system, sensor histidine kinase